MLPLPRRYTDVADLSGNGEDGLRPGTKDLGAALEGSTTRWFKRIVDVIVRLLLPLATIALMMGIARIFIDLWAVYRSPSIAAGFDLLVTDVLSMFVVIELLKSIVEYFEVHRIRITFILDAAVVFTIREVMIGLYKHSLTAAEVAALAALLFALGAFRIAAVLFSPERSGAAATEPGRGGGAQW
ncbi:MAG TPA: phosphate-starvation-inducible PsiE family protein [Anaeromyxobacteraceae bacterium]|nr:phosphate-starvation-inducible PsiE family protein [Anaeromyxobacteraceae bacterium]